MKNAGVMAVTTISAPTRAKKYETTTRSDWDSDESTVSMSRENLLTIRPDGVVSNCGIRLDQQLDRSRRARRETDPTRSRSHDRLEHVVVNPDRGAIGSVVADNGLDHHDNRSPAEDG